MKFILVFTREAPRCRRAYPLQTRHRRRRAGISTPLRTHRLRSGRKLSVVVPGAESNTRDSPDAGPRVGGPLREHAPRPAPSRRPCRPSSRSIIVASGSRSCEGPQGGHQGCAERCIGAGSTAGRAAAAKELLGHQVGNVRAKAREPSRAISPERTATSGSTCPR